MPKRHLRRFSKLFILMLNNIMDMEVKIKELQSFIIPK